jgi:hypothetical protein
MFEWIRLRRTETPKLQVFISSDSTEIVAVWGLHHVEDTSLMALESFLVGQSAGCSVVGLHRPEVDFVLAIAMRGGEHSKFLIPKEAAHLTFDWLTCNHPGTGSIPYFNVFLAVIATSSS